MKTVTYDETQWQLVPKVATDDMEQAAIMVGVPSRSIADKAYEIMLSAAPRRGYANTELAAPIPPAGHYKDALIEDLDDRVEPTPSQSRLTVRLCSFSESNGKRNWTAMFVRVDEWHGLVGNCGGITIEQGEYWNRVAYHAEQAKFLLGERDTEPFILDYAEDIQTPEEWKGEVHTSLRNKS